MTLHQRAMKIFLTRWALAGAALLLASCASTRLEGTWSNPEAKPARIAGRVLVVGLTRDDTLRRQYEDELVSRLTERGLAVTRAYELIKRLGSRDSAPVLEAARKAGATHVLSSAVVSHEYVHRVITEPAPMWHWSYLGWYDHYWGLAWARTEVRTYERYVVSTSLTETAGGRIVWTARTGTDAPDRPERPEREARALARVIVDSLVAAGWL